MFNELFIYLLRLDYCGIAILIMGSFVPWLYYGFYCEPYSWMLYLVLIVALGLVSMVVALWDKFSDPELRPLRAGIFINFLKKFSVTIVLLLLVDINGFC